MKSNLARFRRRAFRRVGVRNAYDELDEEFAFLDEVLRARPSRTEPKFAVDSPTARGVRLVR